jgi:hypothetical protein
MLALEALRSSQIERKARVRWQRIALPKVDQRSLLPMTRIATVTTIEMPEVVNTIATKHREILKHGEILLEFLHLQIRFTPID